MIRHWHHHLAAALLCAGALTVALPAAAQNVSLEFHWRASPLQEAGVDRPAAAFYEVFILRGADGEAFVATVDDTIWSLDAEPDVVQRISVRGVDAEGHAGQFSDWSEPVYFESEGERGVVPPAAPELDSNYPNPFNPSTRIVYGVPEDLADGEPMRLEIFGVDGRRVRSFDVDRSAGWHEVTWDGTDDLGQPASAGLYITRYAVGAMVQTGKMTMVK